MKAARLFPFAFIANVHGLILFVPYLIFCMTLLRMVQIYRARA